jgi:hypothetical protein
MGKAKVACLRDVSNGPLGTLSVPNGPFETSLTKGMGREVCVAGR